MAKIGILTFHTALNYGAIFQTYALQAFLRSLAFEVDVVDYRCAYTEKIYKPFYVSEGKYINAVIRGLFFGNTIQKKRKRFNDFLKKYVCLSKPIYDPKLLLEFVNQYDYFVSGSDQVWSPISANFDKAYFLPFAKDEQKVSYAASIGSATVSEDILKELLNRLEGFSCLSVREQSAKILLEKNGLTKDIFVHVDPTLLLQQSDWEKICSDRFIKEEYVLVFNVEKPFNDIVFAKQYAEKNNLKVIYINDRTIKKDPKIKYVEAPTPEEFLSLFKHAHTVVTNSFHGTAFSIIFKRNFYVELNNQRLFNIRVKDLLEELGIGNRDISLAENIDEISWGEVESALEKKQEAAEEYFNYRLGKR